MATTERLDWPLHPPYGNVHYWEYRDDMGNLRCSGCGIKRSKDEIYAIINRINNGN